MPNLSVKIEYIPKTGIITFLYFRRGEEFSGTVSSLYSPSVGQHFFQLSDDNNSENASYGLEEGVYWRGTSKEKYNGFVSFSKCNKDKIFTNADDVTITVAGANITGFSIFFDLVAQQWATELTVNGKTYYNDGAIFAWKGDEVSPFIIVLKKWNRPNVSARITSISVGLEIEYNRERFNFVQRGMQSVDDNSVLSWGILGQYGKINIIDIDKEIRDLAAIGILKGSAKIPITINLDGNQIGSYVGDRWSYEFNNNIATVELVSIIDKLNNIIYHGYAPQENKTNIAIFDELKKLSEENGIVVKLFDSQTETYLNRIGQRFLNMEQSSLLDAWNKFCNDTATTYYFNENMEMVLIEYL